MASKKASKKSAKTGASKKTKKPKKDKKGKKDKKSKKDKTSEKSSRLKVESKDSPASKKVIPWSHEAQIHYRLSDKTWVEKGWTMLPREKIIHKVVTYKTVPSKPHLQLFKKRRKQFNLSYSSGKPLAQLKKNGNGAIFYPDGKVAVLRQRGRKCNRFIVFNPSKMMSSIEQLIEPARGRSEVRVPEREGGEVRVASKHRNEVRKASKGRRKESGAPSIRTSHQRSLSKTPSNKRKPSSSPSRHRGAAIGAMFDSWGNGVIYDEAGNVRLNFTQREGILVDGPSGLPVKWKWPIRFTKGDSVENLGTQEQIDDAENAPEDRDSDDEEEKKSEKLMPEKMKEKKPTSKGGSKAKMTGNRSKGKMSSKSSELGGKGSKAKKKKSGKSTTESKSSQNSTKKGKKNKSGKNKDGSKTSQQSGKKKKKKGGSSTDTDTTDTAKSVKQKKRKSMAGGDAEKSRKEPDIPEEMLDQELSGLVTDGRGDEFEMVPSEINVVKENFKQQLAEIQAIRNKYFLPGIVPLKPITIKINDYLTFRVFDQSNMNLVFHAQHKMIRMELGCVVDPSEKIKVNKIDPVKWYEGKGVPCQVELFAKRSMNKYKDILNRQREAGAKRLAERRQNEKRFGGPYLK